MLEPPKKIAQMILATVVGLACIAALVWGPPDLRGLFTGLAVASLLVVGIGATTAKAKTGAELLIAAFVPFLTMCGGPGAFALHDWSGGIRAASQGAEDLSPTEAEIDATLSTSHGEITIDGEFDLAPAKAEICLDIRGVISVRVCLVCDPECEPSSLEPLPEQSSWAPVIDSAIGVATDVLVRVIKGVILGQGDDSGCLRVAQLTELASGQ